MRKLIALGLVLAGCGLSDDSFLLDHTRILAVRAEPSHVPPGQRAKITALAGMEDGGVAETDPATVTAGSAMVEHDADGWWLVATPGVAGATLDVGVAIDGAVYPATKQVVFGDEVANPDVTAMQVDGSDAATLAAAVGTTPMLTAISGGSGVSYAWYSGVGKLEHARDAAATLDASAAASGLVVVVVRDGSGGVGWATLPATVR